jgi:Flp pilus assembly CpaE family ATPase
VVGIYDPADGGEAGAELLGSYGVDAVVAAPATVSELVTAMLAVMPAMRASAAAPGDVGPQSDAPGVTNPILAVTGAAGGCGATEFAIALAAALGALTPVVLVDGDTERPALAQRLGLPLQPNLHTVCDRVLHNEPVAGGFLHHRDLPCEVVGGLPDASRWQAVRSRDMAELLFALRADRVPIVNVGAAIYELPCTGPPRFGVGRSVLALADEVVLVTAADPVGVRRGVDWLGAGRDLVAGAPVHLVLNRCPAGIQTRSELEREVARVYDFATIVAVGVDRHVAAAAWRASVPERGSMRRAARRIANEVTIGVAA